MISLRLYVTGKTPSSERVVARLRQALDEQCPGDYELEVRDVFECLEQAYDDLVLATPTLIRRLPRPVRRLVGDLSDKERVLGALDISER